jgi:Ca2+-binding RTX toxin-like protein
MNVHRIPGARPLAVTAGTAAALAIGLATAGPANPAGAAQSPSASVANDTLTVIGTPHGDRIALRLAAGASATMQVDLNDDGTAEQSFDRNTFSRIEVSMLSGSDQFRVDQANGVIDEAATVSGGSGNDTMNGGDGIELFISGSGNDVVDGNRGNDSAVLGSGSDSFRWDPGDGSDIVEGRRGSDTLDFNGAGVAENMSLSANGERSVFLRDAGNIRMDMDGIERLDLTTLGAPDSFTVGDMSGTDFRRADVDLSGPAGGGDGEADVVTVEGTDRADRIDVEADGASVDVEGLRTDVRIAGSETRDRLQVNSRGGNDDVDVDQAVFALIGVAVDLGSGQL